MHRILQRKNEAGKWIAWRRVKSSQTSRGAMSTRLNEVSKTWRKRSVKSWQKWLRQGYSIRLTKFNFQVTDFALRNRNKTILNWRRICLTSPVICGQSTTKSIGTLRWFPRSRQGVYPSWKSINPQHHGRLCVRPVHEAPAGRVERRSFASNLDRSLTVVRTILFLDPWVSGMYAVWWIWELQVDWWTISPKYIARLVNQLICSDSSWNGERDN